MTPFFPTEDSFRGPYIFDQVKAEDFYFTHSYYVDCKDENDILSLSNYGRNFVSSFSKDNIMGTQFHPEKSHPEGFKILENFVKYV